MTTLKHKYNIPNLLLSIVGYKGLPFPGALLGRRPEGDYQADPYEPETEAPVRQERTQKGTALYRQDFRGRWYFMPVEMWHSDIGTVEIPHAVLNVTAKKNIVETQLVGRKGSVKELINIDDYKVTIAGFIQSTDGTYPEDEIARMRELFNMNESVELISALTDLIFDEDDRVVITDMSFPSTPGVEDGQLIRIECQTDKPFELIIE